MFGDDPDPTVTTARVGFEVVSDAHARGLRAGKRLGGHGQEGSEKPIGLGMVNERKGGRGNYGRMQVTNTNASEMHMMT